ncbi:MAG: hypothetical protein GWN07_26515, partial [Actinobacteria bacterium]|nr:hypothetical protein [Actinomycetota bacterium]NIS34166.1 hypothetical protein [Actinomycetota bacterium]NIT97279.1 hypothetical protein [Actinomycetota bacterium]NIU68947.1 hypothetical protein [Actinomycetota bacterium]NIV57476.1 hypothetical protein [Actinomycetota bacterium]
MFTHATTGGAVAKHRARPHRRRGSRPDLRLASVLVTLLLSACGSDTLILTGLDPDVDLSTAEIRIVSGATQDGEVGAPLASPLVVEVVDASGAGLASVQVQWTFSQGRAVGGGSGGQPTVMSTDAQGRSSVTWELGTTAGVQTAEAELVVPSSLSTASGAPGNNNGKKVGFEVRARAGSPTSIDVSPDAPSVTEDESIQLLAAVADAYGNPVEGTSLSWRSSDETVAVVQSTGMVQALTPGQAVVSASWRNVEGSTTVSVMPA